LSVRPAHCSLLNLQRLSKCACLKPGDTGSTGVAGAIGATGDTGDVGPRGADGVNGSQGAPGPAGWSFVAYVMRRAMICEAALGSFALTVRIAEMCCMSHTVIRANVGVKRE